MARASSRLRLGMAREAARLMYEEGVKQYFDAKRMAARRLVGFRSGTKNGCRPRDLPSNGEIREALLELAELTEGQDRAARQFAMRVVALELMADLAAFAPRLIGSVATGHVHRRSDIDLHVFTDAIEELEAELYRLGWAWETELVTIRTGNTFRDYCHIYLVEHPFPVELSVYPKRELRVVTRSSTDGKQIKRLKRAGLEAVIASEHTDAWAHYIATGEVADLARLSEEASRPAFDHDFDGFLGEEGQS